MIDIIKSKVGDFVPISVMVKPSSSACNLKCKYCFYTSLAEARDEAFKGYMNEKTAENIIKSALEYARSTEVFFTFQGGEPLLSGIDFFKMFVEKENRLNLNKSKITNCIQTNATLITDEWCEFFKQNNILVGVSLDGDRELNSYRVYKDGRESFDDVMHGIALLQKHGVTFNILSVLTSRLAQNFRKSYRFFKSNNLHYLQYIPCLKAFDETESEYAMSIGDYSSYLCSAYKLYFNDLSRGVQMSIRQFDNYRLLMQGRPAEQCGMNGFCSEQFVVEGDGSVYPCDFYCTTEYYLGNINDLSFAEISKSETYRSFVKSSFTVPDRCKACDYYTLCRGGGCKRNALSSDYCEAYKMFFKNIIYF